MTNIFDAIKNSVLSPDDERERARRSGIVITDSREETAAREAKVKARQAEIDALIGNRPTIESLQDALEQIDREIVQIQEQMPGLRAQAQNAPHQFGAAHDAALARHAVAREISAAVSRLLQTKRQERRAALAEESNKDKARQALDVAALADWARSLEPFALAYARHRADVKAGAGADAMRPLPQRVQELNALLTSIRDLRRWGLKLDLPPAVAALAAEPTS